MIPIIVTTDEKYTQHLCVMLASLFENNKDVKYHIFIFSDGLAKASQKKILDFTLRYGNNLDFILISTNDIKHFKVHAHVSLATYFRILAFDLVPEHISKALYLDLDLLVLQKLDNLWNTDLGNKLLGVVPHSGDMSKFNTTLDIPHNFSYFNAGVLLVNIKLWKEKSMTQKLIDYINNNLDKIHYWDQDALNAVCYEHCFYLEKKWNMQASFFTENKKNKILYQNTAILHFTGMSKPWEYINKHPYKKLYYKYLKLTPWKGYKPEDKTVGNFLRKHKLMPRFIETILSRNA